MPISAIVLLVLAALALGALGFFVFIIWDDAHPILCEDPETGAFYYRYRFPPFNHQWW